MFSFLQELAYPFAEQQLFSDQLELADQKNSLKAFNHHYEKLLKKSLKILSNNINKQQQNRILGRFFNHWKQQIFLKRICQKQLKNTLNKLRLNIKIGHQKKKNFYQQEMADNFREISLKNYILKNWKKQTILSKKILKVQNQIIKKYWFQKLSNMAILGISAKTTNKIVDSIYNSKLQRLLFSHWKVNLKYCKLQKILKKRHIHLLLNNIRSQIQFFYKKSSGHKQKILKQKYFTKLNYNAKINKYRRINEKKILKKSFKGWNLVLNELFYQKEHEKNSQQIVQQYLVRKQNIMLMYCFQKWKKVNQDRKNIKMKLNIARQFYQLRQKQYLLKKYFSIIKDIKQFNKADSFRRMKLIENSFESLRMNCLKQANKLEKVYKFVENREKRKYFRAIQVFNQMQEKRINYFRLQKYFKAFTLSLVKQYLREKNLSQKYHQKSLLYKSFFAMKRSVEITRKTNKTIIYLNTNLYLKRWWKSYRVRQFVKNREYFKMKSVFLELKILSYVGKKYQKYPDNTDKKKRNSRQKIKQVENNTFKVKRSHRWELSQEQPYIQRSTLEFQQLLVDSPEKMFSLDYSRSAYNSNQNPVY